DLHLPYTFEFGQIPLPHPCLRGRIQLLNRSSKTRTECNRPPIVRRRKRLSVRLFRDADLRNPAGMKQLLKCGRGVASVPWIEAPDQVWPFALYCFPKRAAPWLEHARTPGRDGEPAAFAHHPPELAHRVRHLRDKENSEHANDCVETGIRKSRM